MTRRAATSIAANPVLVGAVTLLVMVVAVFLSYNANNGLPFVPTYDIKAQLPSGGKLVEGNEVRMGGFRVGVIYRIRPEVVRGSSGRHAIAVVSLKLDKAAKPLPVDSRLTVRAQSALGLKYLEIVPGQSSRTLKDGQTIPVRQTAQLADFEDVLATFDKPTRDNIQASLVGAGNAFASRGASLNEAISALNPLFVHLTPVMRILADPSTQLGSAVSQLARLTEQLAPVASIQARLFSEMADTFAAFARDPAALQATIQQSPPTLAVATTSLRAQRPFYISFADLSRRLRPAAELLPTALPRINRALTVGTPVLRRMPAFNENTGKTLRALDSLFRNPRTLIGLHGLRDSVTVTRPALEFIAPYETVCNYTSYFFNPLSTHFGNRVPGGTAQNQGIKFPNLIQRNSLANTESSRPVDVPANQDPQTATNLLGPLNKLIAPVGAPAIDAQGNADCAIGQFGYPFRYLPSGTRYPPSNDPNQGGGSHTALSGDLPGLLGGTYKSRELGIGRLQDVP